MNINDIMQIGQAVQRIVIGDVGSGKTIVSIIIAVLYSLGLEESQVALLAPTEVLVSQHYASLNEFLAANSIDMIHVICITGSKYSIDNIAYTKAPFFKKLQTLQHKRIIWVGTHALLHREEIKPQLVLVDEQHKFGVKQRKHLNQSDDNLSPHFVSFTATPIPRTMALTLYRGLKPHFLETLQGRKNIKTTLSPFEDIQTKIFTCVEDHIKKGRKIYIVCPRIEKDEEENILSVESVFEIFKQEFGDKVLFVHGKSKQKQEILEQFKLDSSVSILVSTTVIEVGVDVSEASLMIIMSGERFGLSTLHQIRGRVGRNNYVDNECIVVTKKEYLRSRRLHYITSIHDGFELAEKDLQLRGAGDVVGTAQSGFNDELANYEGVTDEIRAKIEDLADNLFKKKSGLIQLPRLNTYLEKQSAEVWEE